MLTWKELSRTKRPQAGVTIDETRVVQTMLAAPSSCIRVRCEYADVSLSTTLLEELCELARGDWRTEEERLGFIAAGRAKKLLAAAAQQQPLIAPLAAELSHLLVLLLENGAAYVRHAIDDTPISALEIRYVGQRIAPTAGFGRIIVCEPHVGLPLLTSDWWVA